MNMSSAFVLLFAVTSLCQYGEGKVFEKGKGGEGEMLDGGCLAVCCNRETTRVDEQRVSCEHHLPNERHNSIDIIGRHDIKLSTPVLWVYGEENWEENGNLGEQKFCDVMNGSILVAF